MRKITLKKRAKVSVRKDIAGVAWHYPQCPKRPTFTLLMQLFFTDRIEGDLAHLTEEEARHAFQVLRKQVGDPLHLIDGAGGLYYGPIVEVGKRRGAVRIETRQTEYGKRKYALRIAIAPTKNIGRMEWLVEKATEIGVDAIQLLQCERSERKKVRLDRLEKIALAAAKQSLRAYVPKIQALTRYADWIKTERTGECYVAHCRKGEERHYLLHNYTPPSDVWVLIGPEGDFTVAEIELALARGFQPVSLGEHRLRTETAGIAVCQMIASANALRFHNS